MPRGMPPPMPPQQQKQPSRANPIDDLISAQMMESAVGNPNAPVPTGGQVGRQQRPGIPKSRMPPSAKGGGAPGGNQQQQMIQALFRQAQAARKSGKPVTR